MRHDQITCRIDRDRNAHRSHIIYASTGCRHLRRRHHRLAAVGAVVTIIAWMIVAIIGGAFVRLREVWILPLLGIAVGLAILVGMGYGS